MKKSRQDQHFIYIGVRKSRDIFSRGPDIFPMHTRPRPRSCSRSASGAARSATAPLEYAAPAVAADGPNAILPQNSPGSAPIADLSRRCRPGRFRRQPSGWKGWAMEKWMCFAALGAAGLMLIVFLLDLIAGIPFGGSGSNPFTIVDIFGILASIVVGYLAFNALRDVK